MTSTLYFIERSGIMLLSYMSNATGTIEKTREGLAFTGVEVQVSISVPSDEAVEVARGAAAKAERSCPISKSLGCPVTVVVDIHVPKEVANANL
jgi:organic hydroperoxide reductase OsmC/OhrA